MRHLHSILTFALCLTLLATSVTQAVARGRMATGQMVQLCVGGQAVTVVIDAQGNPAGPVHPCPDCLVVAADLPRVGPEIGPADGRWIRLSLPIPTVLRTQAGFCACARGPPVLV